MIMDITITRKWKTEESTIGELNIKPYFTCYTLEDVEREAGAKIYGKTAIPKGKYQVIPDYSNRFKIIMPHILNVPGFTGVRIHKGNSAKDTEGCILVGAFKGDNRIWDCSSVFDYILRAIKEASNNGEAVSLTIS